MKRIVGDRDSLSSDASDLWFSETYVTLIDDDQPGVPAPRAAASVVAQPALVPSDTLYSSQWHLNGTWGINVQQVWDEYTGQGIRVAVYDEGIDWTHADLAAQVDQSLSLDAVRLTTGGYPVEADDSHGTAVAGLIAAARNGTGVVGVACDATLISIYQGFSFANPGNDAAAFAHARTLADVMNNSWGYGASGIFYDNFASTFAGEGAALASAAQLGRGGLGTNIVFAAANYRSSGGNTNYHNFQNDRHVITVAASDSSGAIASFSTPGASILVTAPGVGIVTTDRVGSAGYTSGDYYTQFGGTSAAAPIVSGVVALMLDANPYLGYRDVQEILAYSARQTSVTSGYQYNGATNWNGAGLHFSNDFGAGLVDARAAVRLAETWGTQRVAANEYGVGLSASPNAAIPDNSTLGLSLGNATAIDIDHVALTVNINHARFSDLTITLISPSGVSSVLASRPAYAGTSLTWTFDSTQFWGENGVGNWSLSVRDNATGGTGTLLSWSLALYGDAPAINDTYVYTDEFSEMFSRDPTHASQRATLNDTDGGIDLFNGAALTGNAVIRLGGGSSTIDGHALTITSEAIENAYGGDGNDTLVGSASVNILYGARGNDRLEGADGNDTLLGGAGSDTFYGGAGSDMLYGGTGVDTASYSDAAARIVADLAPGTVSSAGDLDRLDSIEVLIGSVGNDTLIGSVANDLMTGGAGNDLFVFRPFDAGSDTILDFGTGDHIDASAFGYASIAEIQAAGGGIVQSGGDVILTLSTGSMPLQVRIVGVNLSSMTADRFALVNRDAYGNIIEANGSVSLIASAENYYFESGGTLGPSLKYLSSNVVSGQFGVWTPIGVEAAAGGGYHVVYRLGSADQYTAWHTDTDGNYLSSLTGAVSGSDASIRVLETLFSQDLDTNGTVGLALTAVEAQGATGLSTGAGHYFLAAGGTPVTTLKYLGTDYIAGQFGGWTPIGAEASAGGGYDVAWKVTGSDQYTVWHTGADGNYASSSTVAVSGADYTLQAFETLFGQDLNGDGTIGAIVTQIETSGATGLVARADHYFLQTGGSPDVALRYLDADVVAGQFGGWAPIGAEAAAGGGYDVVWKNGADQYVAWHTGADGNYASSSTGAVSGNDISIQVLETLFDQDLNGDGTTGLALTPIETQGATGLSTGAGRYFFETGGTPEATLKFEGADYVAGQFGGWAPIGAEAAAGGGYDVVWKNGADQYVAWHTDSAGDYVATSTDVVSGNDISIQVLETLFDQD
ncbi:MAG: S8 family serine peptidase, partial [Alphaproteobacteria bacterium]